MESEIKQKLKDLREYIEKQIPYYQKALKETDERDAESFCTGALDALKDILYRL